MKPTCEELVTAYIDWVREGFSVETFGETCEITTPFLDRHNDHLQVYVTPSNGKMVLTDDGYIIGDLEASGVDLSTPKRQRVLQSIVQGFGVRLSDRELVTEASMANVGQKLHSLIQAMLAVNDMFVMAQPRVSSLFWEDVQDFLTLHEVRFTTQVKLAGKSGYDHTIDFLIPRSRRRPERFVQAINSPNKSSISSYLFSITDLREVREFVALAILNDEQRPVSEDVLEAMERYDVSPIVWSRRDEHLGVLVE